jgi:hypothetical protein
MHAPVVGHSTGPMISPYCVPLPCIPQQSTNTALSTVLLYVILTVVDVMYPAKEVECTTCVVAIGPYM